jgi:hypothetical protein
LAAAETNIIASPITDPCRHAIWSAAREPLPASAPVLWEAESRQICVGEHHLRDLVSPDTYRNAVIRLTDMQQLLLHTFRLHVWSDTVRWKLRGGRSGRK